MEFKLNITLGNDAMNTPRDIAETLRKLAWILEDSDIPFPELTLPHSSVIHDANGETVGKWEVTAPERRGFTYGWGEDADGRYAYSYNRERDVSAIWREDDDYIEVNVSGEWSPGKTLYGVSIYTVLPAGDTAFTPGTLTDYFIDSGQAG